MLHVLSSFIVEQIINQIVFGVIVSFQVWNIYFNLGLEHLFSSGLLSILFYFY